MASKKEEVLFSVKAELQGFKKSMEDLKQLAKDSSKNIEKAMSLDLTDEGSKAGKSFAKGMNKELKGFTDTLKKELKLMSDKTYTIKIKLDSSSVDKVIRELSNIEIKVSASASNRANSSMSNNANAPNSANAIASMANTAATASFASEVKKAVDSIAAAISKIDVANIGVDTKNAKVGVDTENAKVGVDVDGVKIGVDTEGVKVGVDTQDVKIDVNTEGVNVGVDSSNIPEIEVKVPEIQSIKAEIDTKDVKVGVDTKDAKVGVDTKDAKVGVDAKNAKVKVDAYDTKVGVDTRGVKVGVETKDARVKIDENSIRQVKSIELDVAPIAKSLQDSGIKIDVDALNESVKALNEALNSLKIASENTKDGADTIAEIISKVTDLITAIEGAFNNGAKTVGTEIYESFSKSAQELYKDLTDLYKVFATKMSEANKSQINNTYTTKATRKSNTLDDAKFKPYTTDDQQKLNKRPRFYVPQNKESIPKTVETNKFKDAEKSFRSIQEIINDVAKSIKESAESIRANTPESIDVNLTPVSDILDKLNEVFKVATSSLDSINDKLAEIFDNGAKTIGTQIHEAFTKSAQELYQDIVELYKVITKNLNQANAKKNAPRTGTGVQELSFGNLSWDKQQKDKQGARFESPLGMSKGAQARRMPLFDLDNLKEASETFKEIQASINDVAKSMKAMFKELTDSIRKALDNDNQIAKADSTSARRKNKEHNFSNLSESEKINQQIEQWKNRLNSLKESISKTTDNDKIAKYEASMVKIGNTIGRLEEKLKELERINGFDETCMTIEEADGAVTKLRMNLQHLASDFKGSFNGFDELTMTVDGDTSDEIESALKQISSCLKVVSDDVKAIRTMLSKSTTRTNESNRREEPVSKDGIKELTDVIESKQVTEQKPSKELSFEERLMKDDDFFKESVADLLGKKLEKDLEFIIGKHPGLGLDIVNGLQVESYRNNLKKGMPGDAPLNFEELLEVSNYIKDIKNEIVSSDLNRAFDVDVNDTINKALEKEESRNLFIKNLDDMKMSLAEFELAYKQVDSIFKNEWQQLLPSGESSSLEKFRNGFISIKEEILDIINQVNKFSMVGDKIEGGVLSKFGFDFVDEDIDSFIKRLNEIEDPVEVGIDPKQIENAKKAMLDFKNILSELNKEYKENNFYLPSEKIRDYKRQVDRVGWADEVEERLLKKLESGGLKRDESGDELSMTLDDASESIAKLRMNLQLLSDDSDDSEDRVKNIRKEIDDIHEQISKLIDNRFKVFDKECEEKIRNSFRKLEKAVEEGAKAIDAVINKYGSDPIGEGKFDKESHAKINKAYDDIEEKYYDFKKAIEPPEMGWHITKDEEEEINGTVKRALDTLQEKIFELEKPLAHLLTVAENLAKMFEELMKIGENEDAVASYKNRTTFNKLYDTLGKQFDEISDDDIPVDQEDSWKELKEMYSTVFKEGLDAIFKPMADDVFREQKEQIDKMRTEVDESYGSEAIRSGLKDVYKKLEEQKDKERRINKSKETVDEFEREFVRPLISDINKSRTDRDVKHDYTQAINGIVERMNEAFGKDTHKETVQEFEAAFRQLEDRMENAPVKDVTKDVIKHIINRMREQIENAYEAYNLDLDVNLPMPNINELLKQLEVFRQRIEDAYNIKMQLEADTEPIKEQVEEVKEHIQNNANLPVVSSLGLPSNFYPEINEQFELIRRKIQGVRDDIENNEIVQVIDVEYREVDTRYNGVGSGMFSTRPNGPIGGPGNGSGRIVDSGEGFVFGGYVDDFEEVGQAADDCTGRVSKLWAMLNQSDAHVFTHKMGQLKESLKKVSDAIKDIGTPFKKAFNGISSVLNKILSPIKKVISGFRNLGNEAKDASGKVNGLTGSFKGLLSKLAMMFGIREIFNIFKEGTKDAMSYEASIINLQLTYGKASQGLIDFANNHAIAFGLSKRQVAEYGNVYSAIMRDVNIAMAKTGETADDIAKKTMDMSQGILESAGIISSALGYDMEYVLEGLRSGLLGSSQAVDQFGLNLKRANLENSKAFKEVANGAESWEKLTVEQQQYVIAQEIINQTASKFGSILDENGKIMRTTASLHTQFLAQWQNTKLAVGNLGKVIWTAILPPLIKILAILEQIFNYAASAMTMILEMFNIKVDLNANLGGNSGLDSLGDTAQDTSDALNGVGDSAQDTAQDTEDAAKKIKRALAGFDQINVLTLGDDAEDNEIETPGLEEWNPTPIDPGELGVQLPDLSDDFKKKLEKLKELFEEFITPFRAAWDILGNRWKKAWEDLKTSFKGFCESLADFLASVWWNGGQEFVRHMAEIALAVGIAAMEIGGTILDALAKLWKHLDPETNMNTQGFLDALNETAVKLRDLILDLNSHLESLMNNGGQEVLNALGDMFMNLGEAAARGVGVAIDAIDGLLDHLDPANNDITRGMLEMWENAFLAIGDAALAFADLMESTLANGGQGVVNALGDLGVQILSTLGSITTDVAEACANLFAHLDPANNDITAGALEGFKYFVDSIRNFIEMLGESFSTFMDNGGQEFLNNMADIALILFDMAVTIGGDLLNAITAFFDSFAGHVLITTVARTLELLSTILKALLELIEPLTPVISAVVAAIGGFMVASKVVTAITTIVTAFQSFGSILGLAKAGVSALWAILAANPIAATVAAIVAIGVALVALYNKCEWFRDIVNSIFDGLREPIEKLKETFSELFEDVVDVFQNIIDFIVGIFTGDGERVGKAVREFVINIGEILLDLFKLQGNLAEIGFNLILGLVQGIWECIKQLPQLLLGIGEFIVDFFKGLFGIHSPSTVFAELGGYLIEGLAQGITDSLNLLDNVFSGVSDAISGAWDKVKTAWSEASDFFGGVWQSVKDTFDKIKDMSIPKPKIEWDTIKETASKVVGNVKETVEKFKADLPKPSVVWDSIKTTAERTISNVKDSVERFKASLPKPTLNWNDLKTTLTDTLNKLKDTISKFKWELPKPKLPSFSVSGGKAPWGFMGQGSLPSISVKWNAQGGIMNSPTIFGMTGNTLLGGGEAGAEAILPLDELWNRLDNSFQQQNQALSRAIASSNNGSNRPVNVVLKVNDIEMGKVVVNSLKSLSNHSGGSLDLPFNK